MDSLEQQKMAGRRQAADLARGESCTCDLLERAGDFRGGRSEDPLFGDVSLVHDSRCPRGIALAIDKLSEGA